MRELTLSEIERLQAIAGEEDVAFEMDEEAFGAFYDRTARALWAYLSRATGDPALADDLLQETYYRFLRARATLDGDVHRRNYLFRIATNLMRDSHRRAAARPQISAAPAPEIADPGPGVSAEERADVSRALRKLKPRERQMLWLAYAQGSSHREIGEALGLKTDSIKPLLFRARRRLAALLGVSAPGGSRRD